jgi:hypothetical protein
VDISTGEGEEEGRQRRTVGNEEGRVGRNDKIGFGLLTKGNETGIWKVRSLHRIPSTITVIPSKQGEILISIMLFVCFFLFFSFLVLVPLLIRFPHISSPFRSRSLNPSRPLNGNPLPPPSRTSSPRHPSHRPSLSSRQRRPPPL